MADLQEDNVLPNEGSYFPFREPESQVRERNKEKAETLQALAIINKVVKHFEERIAFRDSLSSIKVDLTTDPLLHQKTCEVNDLLKLALIEEKEMLEDLLETHGR